MQETSGRGHQQGTKRQFRGRFEGIDKRRRGGTLEGHPTNRRRHADEAKEERVEKRGREEDKHASEEARRAEEQANVEHGEEACRSLVEAAGRERVRGETGS